MERKNKFLIYTPDLSCLHIYKTCYIIFLICNVFVQFYWVCSHIVRFLITCSAGMYCIWMRGKFHLTFDVCRGSLFTHSVIKWLTACHGMIIFSLKGRVYSRGGGTPDAGSCSSEVSCWGLFLTSLA